MNKSKFTSVDAYIKAAPTEAQPVMKELRNLILTTVPKAEETISWNVPYYKQEGELAGFSLAKKHVTFGIGATVFTDEVRSELEKKGYKTGKATFQILFDQKLPSSMIKKLLKHKLKINKEK